MLHLKVTPAVNVGGEQVELEGRFEAIEKQHRSEADGHGKHRRHRSAPIAEQVPYGKGPFSHVGLKAVRRTCPYPYARLTESPHRVV
jgi:hypothetical protein